MRSSVELVEVGPRDGLQNEPKIVTTADKIALIVALEAAGAKRIEVASFVNLARVPQMADADAVLAGLPASDAIRIGLVLNARGAERAIAAGVDQLGAVCIASDAFGIANQGQSSAESLAVATAIMAQARIAGRSGQVMIAAAFGCPFSGEVSQDRVVEMARGAADSGTVEIALADTIGVAVPHDVAARVARVVAAVSPLRVRVHFHDTRGTGLGNVWAAIGAGARTIDASIGGLGGCPFASGASGMSRPRTSHGCWRGRT